LWDISGALLPNIFKFFQKSFFESNFALDLLKIHFKGLLKMSNKSSQKMIFR
jgi:hypothetical protein